ncbi:MAG: QueT transporter family protein [Lachnospiraceae bacterium]|nr:QueT transporter family protein [Lachnospiraceae bacterium]
MNVKKITTAAAIAAIYTVLTLLANALGLANGDIQVRFSEALTVLPCVTASAVPGLAVGCLLSNILTGCALPDIIFGTLATLLGALGTYAIRKHEKLSWLPPVLANALIIPFVLRYAYGIEEPPMWVFFFTVGAGELISCGILGMLLLRSLKKTNALNLLKDDSEV